MKTRRIVCVGVGGQGNLLVSRLLGEAAISAGIPAVLGETHGMAQRGGIVESAVLMGNVKSPVVSEGEADILVGFEPVETLRALGKCNKESLIITNTHPLPPFTVSIGRGSYPPVDEILDLMGARVKRIIALDGNALAAKAGNPLSLNMVMLGALMGSHEIPISMTVMKGTITASTHKDFLEYNLKAFDLGMINAESVD